MHSSSVVLLNHVGLNPVQVLESAGVMRLSIVGEGRVISPAALADEATVTIAAVHLALDEALLDAAEAGLAGETLRIWEFAEPTAVLGRGSKISVEVDQRRCEAESIPIVRRCSGGASIVAGPGCLMYSIVLDMRQRPELRRLDAAHQFVIESLKSSINTLLPGISMQGTCDLTWNDRKFSGNSLRVARDHLLYHGTLLYAADLPQISRCLGTPPRQPQYRQGRDHASFITNVPLDQGLLVKAVLRAFQVDRYLAHFDAPIVDQSHLPIHDEAFVEYLIRQTRDLVYSRYGLSSWTNRH